MNIGGFLKFSTIDYPDKLSAVIFCQGCRLKCTYCYNTSLRDINEEGYHKWETIYTFLKERVGKLEAVVFSGGEPLEQDDLLEKIKLVKELGYLVGIHTAGIKPNKLKEVINYIDWIGFDIKSPFDYNYDLITGRKNIHRAVKMSYR